MPPPRPLSLVIAIAMGLLGAGPADALSIASFDPQVVFTGTDPAQLVALDAAVGITGFTIESFEDVTLTPGLTVEYEGLGELGSVPASDLVDTLPDAIWDGTRGLNPIALPAEPDVIFRVAGGARSFGIGASDFEGPTRLFVNDVDFGAVMDLPNYSRTGDNAREVYIRIDAGPGERIDSVRFSLPLGESGDGFLFDRIAVQPVPEPSSGLLLGLGLAALAARRCAGG